MDNLRAAGATVDPAGTASADFSAPEKQLLTVNGEDIQAFEFESTEPVPTATLTRTPTPIPTLTPTPTITVIQFGTPDSDFASGVAIDGAGNVYLVGGIQGGALPGQTSLGDADAYLRKYDGQGNEFWTQQFGTQREDHGTAVTVDGAANVYVVGLTRGAFPGHTGLVGSDYDAYLRKYDGDGNELWTRQSAAQGEDHALDVAVDVAGNVYVVGSSSGALPGQTDMGEGDAFIRKYDGDGNELWTRQFGSQDWDSANGLGIDDAANVYVVGSASGALPGQTHLGNSDAFIGKYDGDGNELWTRQFGSQEGDSANGVGVDDAGNVYVVGSSSGALPGQTHLGKSDAYVRKYDGLGNELWTRQFGSLGRDRANGVVVDGAGNLYVSGTTRLSLPGQSNMEPVVGGLTSLYASMIAMGMSSGQTSSALRKGTESEVWWWMVRGTCMSWAPLRAHSLVRLIRDRMTHLF